MAFPLSVTFVYVLDSLLKKRRQRQLWSLPPLDTVLLPFSCTLRSARPLLSRLLQPIYILKNTRSSKLLFTSFFLAHTDRTQWEGYGRKIYGRTIKSCHG